jgi:hypothetical protein
VGWSWSWCVAVMVVRGERVDGVSGGGWWSGHQGMGWSLGYGVVVGCGVVVGVWGGCWGVKWWLGMREWVVAIIMWWL